MSYDAYVWRCGDSCDCSQPVIQRRTEVLEAGPGSRLVSASTVTLWTGKYLIHGDGYDDEGDPEEELAQALAYLEALA